jgi:hypothetical protein
MTSALGTHDPGAPGAALYPLSGGTDNKAFPRPGIKGYGFAPLKLLPELIFPPCSMALTRAARRVSVWQASWGPAARDLLD